MSRIEKLAIRGIRSFDPQEEVKIEFFRPLTLIQGHNGSGKTTIIECLKMASCGSLPPLATNGKTFICDPKINNCSTETKASIKLKFLTPREKEVLIIRNFQLSIKNNKYEFKRLEQLLKSYNSNGELVTINSTCIDIDKQVPLLMHSSKAILENVIFCHQEETNWPFTEAGNLKKVFDEIFDTAKYTKSLEDLKELNKEYTAKSKELKQRIELIQKDLEHHKKINNNVDLTNSKIEEINKNVQELTENISKASKDFKQIVEYEEQFRQKENEINLIKLKMEEKTKQIHTILSDPYFQNYTENEETYEAFVASYKNFLQNESVKLQSEETKSRHLRNNIEKFQFDLRALNDEINLVDANIISKHQLYNNFTFNKNELISNMNAIEALELKIENSFSLKKIYQSLVEKENENKARINSLDEKKKYFELKMSEKMNDSEVHKALIENKKRDIEFLEMKKLEHSRTLENFSQNANILNEINMKIRKLGEEINSVENNEAMEIESRLQEEEEEKNLYEEKIKNFQENFSNKNNDVILFYLTKIKDNISRYHLIENTIQEKIKNFNKIFNTVYPYDTENFLLSLDEILNHVQSQKEEILEEKLKIKEQNSLINMQIEILEENLNKTHTQISSNFKIQKDLFNEIKFLFEKFKIPITQMDDLTWISNEVNKLFMFREDVEKVLSGMNFERNTKQMEIKFLEEYIRTLQEEDECALCQKPANKSEIANIKSTLVTKISQLNEMLKNIKIKIDEKNIIIEEMKKVDSILKKLQETIADNKKLTDARSEKETELNQLYSKRKISENNSKEKTHVLNNLVRCLGDNSNNEEIYKMKNEFVDVKAMIEKSCRDLNMDVLFNNNPFNTAWILTQVERKEHLIKEFLKLDSQLLLLNSRIQENQMRKSTILIRLNKLNTELRNFEGEKAKISKFTDTNEITNKLSEINGEIAAKKEERETMILESSKLSEIKILLNNKKSEFEAIYYQKYEKYRRLIEKINSFKVKIEVMIGDIEHFLQSNQGNSYNRLNSMNDGEEDTISSYELIEETFTKQITELKKDKESKEIRRGIIEKEMHKLTDELNLQENENKKYVIKENLYNNNMILYTLKQEIKEYSEYMSKNENKITINTKIASAKEKINDKLNLLNSQYNLNLGKIYELNNNLNKFNNELKNDLFYDIDNRGNRLKLEYILSIETSKQIESYYEALDQSLLKYHGLRMEEINKLINYYWNMTYKGMDIKWIEIRSDVEKTGRSRSYNYRIVFGTDNDQEMDMRGRCSAGQKVLASIIIRLALAETFCNNCGILCLDEPTTNLDEQHSRSLAKALREIIQSRSEDTNFQLIVITHDPTFVDMIGSDFCDSYWYVSKNEKRFSTIDLKPINTIFNN